MIQELIGKKLDKGIRRYLLKYYPNEADDIRKKAEEIFPSVAEKGPLIGGAKNGLYIDLVLASGGNRHPQSHRNDQS